MEFMKGGMMIAHEEVVEQSCADQTERQSNKVGEMFSQYCNTKPQSLLVSQQQTPIRVEEP